MYAELKRKCRTCEQLKEKKEFQRISRGKQTTQPDCVRCRQEKEFVRGLKRNYNITKETYLALLDKQKKSCAACGEHESNFKRRLHVDHDHKTGLIRGLLCTRCNPLIGMAKEDPNRMILAAAYLLKFKK
jgi:hypothetical protein